MLSSSSSSSLPFNPTDGEYANLPPKTTSLSHEAQASNNEKDTSPTPRWRRYLATIKWFTIDQWFLIAMAVLVLTSSQVQVPASGQAQKETLVTYLCVAVIFFITGCTLPTKTLLQNYGRWKIHLLVQLQCFLLTSATIFGTVSICATNRSFMNSGLLVGMIFLGCVPTTISSNVIMTRQAHGNEVLTVVQSTLGNLLGPFFTPLLIEMYTSTGVWYTQILPPPGSLGAVYERVFKQLGLSIFLPLAIGQFTQYLFPKLTKKVFLVWKFNKLASFSLLILIWQVYDSAFETGVLTSVKNDNIIFIVFVSIALFLLWTAICVSLSLPWLGKKDTIAVAYCVPAKTPAMGVPLSVVMFSGLTTQTKAEIQIPMVIFQGLQIAGGSLMTIAFRKWVAPDEERADAESKLERLEGAHGSELSVEGISTRDFGSNAQSV